VEFHIKWLGFDSSDNTWEKRSDLIADGLEVSQFEHAVIALIEAHCRAQDQSTYDYDFCVCVLAT
jgi:hypothetical protein